jgi:hypothetical protein
VVAINKKELNKKQLIVVLVMGAVFGLFYIYTVFTIPVYTSLEFIYAFKFMLSYTIPILIIGGLLIYILSDKKK